VPDAFGDVLGGAAMLLFRGDGYVERVEERQMTVLKLMAIQLRQMGADGLCNGECGCELGDLAPCEDYMGDCVPAIAVKAFDEEGERETSYIPLERLE
jgi:hypothetical protein